MNPITGIRSELAASIDQILQSQARRNELTIARIRVVALAVVAGMDFLLWWQPTGVVLPHPFPAANAMHALAGLAAAVVVERLLAAGWYRNWLRLALPAADCLLLLSLFVVVLLTAGTPESVTPAMVNAGIGCAVLALSGSLRLHRGAAWTTTLLAVAAFFTIAALGSQPLVLALFSCALLLGAGLMGMWLNAIARHSLQSEVGRLVLGRFLPPAIVEAIHAAPLDLVASPRRREVTVVVTDLRGFTASAETLSPERVLEMLNRVQGIFADIVESHGGRVDKFMGDGMLAVFGMEGDGAAPHAKQAVEAARSMREASSGIHDDAGRAARVGIGVHSGPVVAGCLGSGLRMEYTVVGDTVNTAARLQDLTKELGVDVIVSGTTRVASGIEELVPLGQYAVRGRQGSLDLYAARG